MPNGKVHDRISFIFTPIVLGVCLFMTDNYLHIILILVSFIFSSFMFNGDLDTNSRPYNRWWIFKMIWIPYQLMFHHRSIWTHGIIIGTIVRVLYIGIIPIGIFWFYYNIDIIKFLDWNYLIPILIGLELGSSIHTISDQLF